MLPQRSTLQWTDGPPTIFAPTGFAEPLVYLANSVDSTHLCVGSPVWPSALIDADDPLIVDAQASCSSGGDVHSDAMTVEDLVLEWPDAISSASVRPAKTSNFAVSDAGAGVGDHCSGGDGFCNEVIFRRR